MIMMMMSTGDIDEECDMEGDRHLLSNHADIEATINNTIEHFLYEESFREQQKFSWISFAEARTFSRFFQRALGDLNFSIIPTNNERNQRKS